MRNDFAQAFRAVFLAHLDEHFCVKPERATFLNDGAHGCHVDGVLALVVSRSAPVNLVTLPVGDPRAFTFGPLVVETLYDVAMAISKNSRQIIALVAFGQQKGTTSFKRIWIDPVCEAHCLKFRDHGFVNVAMKFG